MVSDPQKSLAEGAITPWRRGTKPMQAYYRSLQSALVKHFAVDDHIPFADLPEAFKKALYYGTGDEAIQINVGGNGNTSLTFAKGVNAKIYFAGNYSLKASNTFNNNVDGAAGVYQADGVSPSTNVSRAAHLQFYGINPPAGTTQTIDVNPGGGGGNQLWAMFYAPGADFQMHGNPDLFGAVVCKTFYGNGNCGFHYDEAAKWTAGPAVNFRIASYIEDVR